MTCFRIFWAVTLLGFFLLINPLHAGETHKLIIQKDQVSPNSNISITKGDVVYWSTEKISATLTLKQDSQDISGIIPVNGFRKEEENQRLFAEVEKDHGAGIQFTETGTFTYSLDGLNPNHSAFKCGIDVIPHSVEGKITVTESSSPAAKPSDS